MDVMTDKMGLKVIRREVFVDKRSVVACCERGHVAEIVGIASSILTWRI